MMNRVSIRFRPYNMNNIQDPNLGGTQQAADPENPPAEPIPHDEDDMDVVDVVEQGEGGTDLAPPIYFPIESYTISAPAAANGSLMNSAVPPEDDNQEEDPISQLPGQDTSDSLLPDLVYQEDPGYGDDSDYEDPSENGFDDGDQEMTEPVENSPYLYRYPQQPYNLRLQQHQPLVLRFHPNDIVPWIALLPLVWASTVQVDPAGPWGG